MNYEIVERRYLRVIRKCATLSGIWPGQSTCEKYIARAICGFLVVTCFSTQLARILYLKSIPACLEQMCFIGATAAVPLKQGNYIVHDTQYKKLLDGMKHDWTAKRPKAELDILIQYAEKGYFLTIIYLITAGTTLVLFLQMPLTPKVLDIFLPRNESRELGYVYPAYYPFDHQKYHAYIILHMTSGILALTFVFIASDTSFMYTVQHACGLLAVAGYRFESAVSEHSAANEKGVYSDEVYRNVCHSITAHQCALRYLKTIRDTHDVYLFILVGAVIITFSVTLVKVSYMEFCAELIKDYAFLVVQLIHIFYLSIQGQFVMDSFDELYQKVYEARWYHCDRRTQLLYVLVLRYNLTPPIVTAGGLITLNLETFAEILKASVSYFTVLKTA